MPPTVSTASSMESRTPTTLAKDYFPTYFRYINFGSVVPFPVNFIRNQIIYHMNYDLFYFNDLPLDPTFSDIFLAAALAKSTCKSTKAFTTWVENYTTSPVPDCTFLI